MCVQDCLRQDTLILFELPLAVNLLFHAEDLRMQENAVFSSIEYFLKRYPYPLPLDLSVSAAEVDLPYISVQVLSNSMLSVRGWMMMGKFSQLRKDGKQIFTHLPVILATV